VSECRESGTAWRTPPPVPETASESFGHRTACLEHTLLRRNRAAAMLDREKIVAVLKRRFPDSTPAAIAAAANALVGLEDDWMELSLPHRSDDACREGCYLQQMMHEQEIRVFSRQTRENG
jgi:hypothetical protein